MKTSPAAATLLGGDDQVRVTRSESAPAAERIGDCTSSLRQSPMEKAVGLVPDSTHETIVDHVLDFVRDRTRFGEKLAIVTLVAIDGSSPRPLGAQMAVSETGQWVGYLSGGCLERAVVAEALAVLEEGANRRVRYGRGSKYVDIRLSCGGAMEVVFDVHVAATEVQRALGALERRRPAFLRIPDVGSDRAFMRRYLPRRRLMIVGVGPAAVFLGRLAAQSGLEVVLYSPDASTRNTFSRDNLLSIPIRAGAAADFDADPWTAIVFMFHDHDWEADLVPAALATSAFYIGAMGSRSTHNERIRMLERKGVAPALVARLRSPCGVSPGGKTAQAVAVSILAEVLQIDQAVNREGLDAA